MGLSEEKKAKLAEIEAAIAEYNARKAPGVVPPQAGEESPQLSAAQKSIMVEFGKAVPPPPPPTVAQVGPPGAPPPRVQPGIQQAEGPELKATYE